MTTPFDEEVQHDLPDGQTDDVVVNVPVPLLIRLWRALFKREDDNDPV